MYFTLLPHVARDAASVRLSLLGHLRIGGGKDYQQGETINTSSFSRTIRSTYLYELLCSRVLLSHNHTALENSHTPSPILCYFCANYIKNQISKMKLISTSLMIAAFLAAATVAAPIEKLVRRPIQQHSSLKTNSSASLWE
jgi:hypothetical protein